MCDYVLNCLMFYGRLYILCLFKPCTCFLSGSMRCCWWKNIIQYISFVSSYKFFVWSYAKILVSCSLLDNMFFSLLYLMAEYILHVWLHVLMLVTYYLCSMLTCSMSGHMLKVWIQAGLFVFCLIISSVTTCFLFR